MNELALVESRSLRAEYVDRVEVLDKVKALTFFPDGIHVDGPGVAAYYEVTAEAIKKVAQRNRAELEEHGMRILRGAEYREFASVNGVAPEGGDTLSLASSQNTVTVFTRRTILNVGQMLTGSKVAKAIRTYLLDAEERDRGKGAFEVRQLGRKITYVDSEILSFDEAMAVYFQERGGDFDTPYFTRILRAAGYLRQGGCVPRKKKRKFFFFNGGSWEIRTWALPLLFFEFEQTMQELSPRPWNQPRLDEGLAKPVMPLRRGES